MKSNYDHLRELAGDNDEMVEFIDAAESEFDSVSDDLKKSEESVNSLESSIRELEEEPPFESINLGLDTVNFFFDKGNIMVRSKFDAMMQELCTIENRVVYTQDY